MELEFVFSIFTTRVRKHLGNSAPFLPSRRHRGSGKNLGHGLWFGAHQREVSDVSMMLNSPWPEGSERSDECAVVVNKRKYNVVGHKH